MVNIEQPDDTQAKRERSPSFPYADLGESMELVKKIYAVAKMNEIRLVDAADTLGMTPKSGSFMRYISAMSQFGLIDVSGAGDQRRVKISQNGRRMLEDDRPGVRESLYSNSALLPKLIGGLFRGDDGMPHWGRDRPVDRVAESILRFDLNFTQDAARRFLAVYDATIIHIIDDIAESEGDAGNNEVDNLEPDVVSLESQSVQKMVPQMQPQVMEKAQEMELNDIDFQNAGKGKIKISAVLDSEGLDILEKKIAAFRMLLN